MPRMLRLERPGTLVHIMARGIDGHPIYRDDVDRREFLSRLRTGLGQTGFRCLAWCLMDNHYHLFLRTNENPMSLLMRALNGGYARWYNRRANRRGYLFQDRYKSILCQDREYARRLIRYIHLNPVRGGKVGSLSALSTWAWCSHGLVIGCKDMPGEGTIQRSETLLRFGNRQSEAIEYYHAYLAEGMDSEQPSRAGNLDTAASFETAGAHKGWPAVMGDSQFAHEAMMEHEVRRRRRHRQADYLHVLGQVAAQECGVAGLEPEALHKRGRGDVRSRLRARFCRRAHIEELIPHGVIAAYLGVSLGGVAKLIRRDHAGPVVRGAK